ncbi:MAG: hypothetical protein OEY89_16125, partial [Gammaproteobacteria bacterium]|nr:hypothetical protein [Gammaproteobacteria bacterium]
MKYFDFKIIKNESKQLLAAIALSITPTFSHAALMHYTFEGTVTGFDSYHSELDISDFDVVVG